MMLDSSRLQLAETLFGRLVKLPAGDRGLLLNHACGPDYELRDYVERLLRHDDSGMGAFLGVPLAGRLTVPGAAGDSILPKSIGGYRVLRRLGEGGMGVVYEGEQPHTQRRVALKAIRDIALNDRSLRRFHFEAEVLARLRHPGIAMIYEFDVGEVCYADLPPRRQPFFAMELVQGQPLNVYADKRCLRLNERLELLADVCEAVHHAHQKGVIHRDLKPGNILVDAGGQPRILDFGVARVFDETTRGQTAFTAMGQLLGTVAYMSPEQLGGNAHSVDTRSDVYSLGVVAYELLTGVPPIDVANQPLPQAVRKLAEAEAPPAGTIRPALRGDIEAILVKALEKEPERRYSSAAELALDLRRHLRNEPISARPASMVYQARKFARRNRLLVGAALAVIMTLAGATVWTTWALHRTRRATSRAVAINEFLEGIIATTDPATGRADVRLAEVLREAADDAATRFRDHPELEGDVRHMLGKAFQNLSLYPDALIHMSRAHEIRVAALGAADPATLESASYYAWLLYQARRLDEAMRVAEDALRLIPPGEESSPRALYLRRTIAGIWSIREEFDRAEGEFRLVVETAKRSLGERSRETLSCINDLAYFLWVRGVRDRTIDERRYLEEGAALLMGIIEVQNEVFTESTYRPLNSRANLAQQLWKLGRYEEAADQALRVLELAPARMGEGHEVVARACNSLRSIRFEQRRFRESADYLVRTIELIRGRRGGQDNGETLAKMSDGLPILDAADDLAHGEAYSRILYERFSAMAGHRNAAPTRYRTHLARFLSRQGKLAEAEEHFSAILADQVEADDMVAQIRINLCYGGHLAALGRFEEAEQRLLAARAVCEPANWWLVVIQKELARMYDAWGRPDEGEKWHALAMRPMNTLSD